MKLNRIFRIVFPVAVSAVAAGICLLGVISSPVAAADTQVQSSMTLQLQNMTQRDGTEYQVLAARLTAQDGSPLSEKTVTFFEQTDVFGTANVPLGSAVTSSFGVATLKYETGQAGTHTILAVFSGDQAASSSQVTADVQVTNPSLVINDAPTTMSNITRWTEVGVGIVLLSVIMLLASVVFRLLKDVAVNRAHN